MEPVEAADFFEEDEDPADIVAAFERSDHRGVTAPPQRKIPQLAEYYDTHCSVCDSELIKGECHPCLQLLETEEWHGTAYGYSKRKCRGPLCRKAWADHARRERERLSQIDPRAIPHGLGGYTNYKCRCDKCKQGQADYGRALQERRRRAKRKAGDPPPGASGQPAD